MKSGVLCSFVALFGLLLILSVGGVAQILATADIYATQGPDGKYFVTGKVVNSLTGEPIADALVKAQRTDTVSDRTSLSGPNGEFKLDALSAPEQQISAEKPGFVADRRDSWRDERKSRHFDKSDPNYSTPHAGSIVLRLVPEASITVHMEDANGTPISGARLRFITVTLFQGRKRWDEYYLPRNHITDKDGNYTVTQLNAGRYYIAAQAFPEFSTSFPLPCEAGGYPSIVYYPNKPDLESASPLDIEAGQHLTISFVLKRQRLFRVAGRISGQGASLVEILDPSGGPVRFAKSVPQTGKFDFGGLTAGIYTLQVHGPGNTSWERILHLNTDRADLVLKPQPKMRIPVHVRYDGVNPPPPELHGYIDVILHATEQPLRIDSSSLFDQSTLEIWQIHPGKYALAEVIAADNEYVASIHSGSIDLLQHELTIDSDASPDPIELVMRNDAASLAGRVISDRQQESTIVVVPEAAPTRFRIVDASADGGFEVKSLAPGNYRILAFDSIGGIDFEDPAIMAQYASKATAATLQADHTTHISLNLIHNTKIE